MEITKFVAEYQQATDNAENHKTEKITNIEFCEISSKKIRKIKIINPKSPKRTKLSENDVEKEFEKFLTKCVRCNTAEKISQVKKAYQLAKEAHTGQTRYNGDAFISHPVEVAKIVTLDIGLGTRSVIAALLHDVPTNTDIDIDEIEQNFGEEIAGLVKGLAHIKGTSEAFSDNKSDVYRKVLIEIASDLRIIHKNC